MRSRIVELRSAKESSSPFPDKAAEYIFVLDGKERLSAIHDKLGDVLYLWRGEKARPAVSIESQEGHLARIDPDTGELVGFTIFGWDGELRERGKGGRTRRLTARFHRPPRRSVKA